MSDSPTTGIPLLPAGVCDSHMHFYDGRYEAAPEAVLRPPDATVEEYRSLQAHLGLDRVVVVQPTTYGLDNSCQLDAMVSFGDHARGVMVVDHQTSADELGRLTDLGVCGARFHMLPGGAVPWDIIDQVAGNIAPYGWHIQLQFNGRELTDRLDHLRRLPVDLVFDHVGRFMPPVPIDDAAFSALLALVDDGARVKLSAPYESSMDGPPGYDDVVPLVAELIARAPQQLLWATNWPHPGQGTPPTATTSQRCSPHGCRPTPCRNKYWSITRPRSTASRRSTHKTTRIPMTDQPANYASYPSLVDRTVFITGGADGIGSGMVEQFVKQGAKVGFADRNVEKAEATLARCAEASPRHQPQFYEVDLVDIDALRQVVERATADLGSISVLVNNAASDDRHTWEEMTPEYWDDRLNSNLRHYFFAIQAVAPAMIEAQNGSIINIGSSSYMMQEDFFPGYAIAKSGVEGITRTLARTFGPSNVRVNTVLPGWVATERQLTKWWSPEGEEGTLNDQALKRRIYPEEFAQMVLFLAADDGAACTAQEFLVDGGRR